MTLGMIYWVIMLIWLLAGVGVSFKNGLDPQYRHLIVGNLLIFLLFLLLGWKVFGPIVR